MHKAFTWLGGAFAAAGGYLLAHASQVQTVTDAAQQAFPQNKTVGAVALALGIVTAMTGKSVTHQ